MEDRVKICVGKGKYEYLNHDDVYNDSESDVNYESDDDIPIVANENSPPVPSLLLDDPTDFDFPAVNDIVHEDLDPDLDEELENLLEQFDTIGKLPCTLHRCVDS